MKRLLNISLTYTAGLRLANIGGIFLLQVFLARILSASEFGSFSFSMSLAQVIGFSAVLGVPAATVRFVSESLATGKTKKAAIQITNAAGLTILFVAVTAILTVVFGHQYFGLSLISAFVFALWIAAFSLRIFAQEVLRAQQHFILSSAFSGVLSVFASLVTLGLWHVISPSSLTLQICLAIVALSFFAVSLTGTLLVIAQPLRLALPMRACGLSLQTIKRITSVGLPLFFAMLFITQAREASIVIVGLALDDQQLGLYAWGTRMGQFAFLPAMVAYPFFAPLIAEAIAQQDPRAQLKILLHYTGLMSAASFLILGLLVFFGSMLSTFTAGPAFVASSNVIIIVAVSYFILTLCGVADYALSVLGQQKKLLALSVLIVLPALPATYFAAKVFGIEGAAATFGAFMILRGLVCAYWVTSCIQFPLHALPFFRASGPSISAPEQS